MVDPKKLNQDLDETTLCEDKLEWIDRDPELAALRELYPETLSRLFELFHPLNSEEIRQIQNQVEELKQVVDQVSEDLKEVGQKKGD